MEGEADVEGAAEVVEVALEEAAVGHACNEEEAKIRPLKTFIFDTILDRDRDRISLPSFNSTA